MIWLALALASIGAGWLFGNGNWATNLGIMSDNWGPDLTTALLGVPAGFMLRDRVRLRRSYASPTRAHLAKLVVFASTAAAAAFSLSPVAWDAQCLRVFALFAASGAAFWLGNLPVRL